MDVVVPDASVGTFHLGSVAALVCTRMMAGTAGGGAQEREEQRKQKKQKYTVVRYFRNTTVVVRLQDSDYRTANNPRKRACIRLRASWQV